jgi:hypothetical protein
MGYTVLAEIMPAKNKERHSAQSLSLSLGSRPIAQNVLQGRCGSCRYRDDDLFDALVAPNGVLPCAASESIRPSL